MLFLRHSIDQSRSEKERNHYVTTASG